MFHFLKSDMKTHSALVLWSIGPFALWSICWQAQNIVFLDFCLKFQCFASFWCLHSQKYFAKPTLVTQNTQKKGITDFYFQNIYSVTWIGRTYIYIQFWHWMITHQSEQWWPPQSSYIYKKIKDYADEAGVWSQFGFLEEMMIPVCLYCI